MTLFDRYVIGLFLKILAVCYLSLAGLYLIIDVFGNIDEFMSLGRQRGGLWLVLANYYGPRLIALFCEVAGLLYLLAAICTLTRLQNTSELSAVQSAGVSVKRVAMPLLVMTGLLSVGTLLAREVLLPKFSDTLVQNAQDMLKAEGQSVKSQIDYHSLVRIDGDSVDYHGRKITGMKVLLPHDWPSDERELRAEVAVWRPAEFGRPTGFLLKGVEAKTAPERSSSPGMARAQSAATVQSEGQVLLYGPGSEQWLKEGERFLPTGVPFSQICFGPTWVQHASIAEVARASQSGAIRLPAGHRVSVHWRMVRPFMDFCLLLIGLPLVLRGNEMKLVSAAATCLGLVCVIQLVVAVFHFLGGQQILNPAGLAAWAPALLACPFGFLLFSKFNR